MKYTVQVCMTYVHVMDVEADSQDEAERLAFGMFEDRKSTRLNSSH